MDTKTTIVLIISIFGIIILNSCEKLTGRIWVKYNETKCADPWGSTENTSEKEKIKMIETYFSARNVKIFKVKITEDGNFESCESCGCKSGRRIKCKVKEIDVEKMKNEGFYE